MPDFIPLMFLPILSPNCPFTYCFAHLLIFNSISISLFIFNQGIQYFYVIYLTILLLDRAIRDDERCRKKYISYILFELACTVFKCLPDRFLSIWRYGKYWDLYCKKVPYKVIPFVFWGKSPWKNCSPGLQFYFNFLLQFSMIISDSLKWLGLLIKAS